MKIRVLFLVAFLILSLSNLPLYAQKSGEELFKSVCAACHTVGNGKLIGPDLSGVNDRRDQEWLIRFIRSSQKMVSEGDSLAVALFNEYNNIPMPDNNLSDDEILSILNYIGETGTGATRVTTSAEAAADTAAQVAAINYSDDLLREGKALFYGYESFSNGASSCMACHFIQDESIIGGGKLSLDLTGAYSKLGQAGIQAILTNPPFPAMNTALRGKNMTEDEKVALIAMLHFVDQRYNKPHPDQTGGLTFVVLSLVFSLFLLVNIYLLYDNRKIPA